MLNSIRSALLLSFVVMQSRHADEGPEIDRAFDLDIDKSITNMCDSNPNAMLEVMLVGTWAVSETPGVKVTLKRECSMQETLIADVIGFSYAYSVIEKFSVTDLTKKKHNKRIQNGASASDS